MKKYEMMTGSPRSYYGKTIYRIKALKEFGLVKAGDTGGWVESDDCVSHEGNCWIGPKVIVTENARVIDDAIVTGNLRIRGETLISGETMVSGSGYLTNKPAFGLFDDVKRDLEDAHKMQLKIDKSNKVPEPVIVKKKEIIEEVEEEIPEPKKITTPVEEPKEIEESEDDDFDFLD